MDLNRPGKVNPSSSPQLQGKELAMERPYSVLLADGHQMVRQGVKRIIETMDGLQVVAEASDGVELLEILKNQVPDMVIIDISMPSLRDLEAIRKIKAIYGDIKVLFLSMHENPEYRDYALGSGAEGFVIKYNLDQELSQAIDKIRGGEIFISPLVGQKPEEN
jgi:two-component system response regulator NreC